MVVMYRLFTSALYCCSESQKYRAAYSQPGKTSNSSLFTTECISFYYHEVKKMLFGPLKVRTVCTWYPVYQLVQRKVLPLNSSIVSIKQNIENRIVMGSAFLTYGEQPKDILKVENTFNINCQWIYGFLLLLVHPRHFHIMGTILHFLFIKKYHHTECRIS